MGRRNLDTQGTGKKAFTAVQTIIQDAGHFIQAIDGDTDNSIDGYIRLRKKVKFKKNIRNKRVPVEDYADTGDLIGIQVKGVSSIPKTGSNSYYINLADKAKFGINFSKKSALDKHRAVWKNFIGPVIIVLVDLETGGAWWADVNDEKSYNDTGYIVVVEKSNVFNFAAFSRIKKLGKELFAERALPEVSIKNQSGFLISLTDFKQSAKEAYKALAGEGLWGQPPTINPQLGEIKYSRSGWKHITRLNRRKMRIFNSIMLLNVAKEICETVENFTRVKKGEVRESQRFIKKVEFLTLRAKVNFNYRQSAIVQVVLRRIKTFDKVHVGVQVPEQVYFHSVYEPYRKE